MNNVQFLHSYYEDNIRRTTIPARREDVYIRKKVLQQINIASDRAFDLRIALSHEEPISADISSRLSIQEPKTVGYVQRKSYVETLPNGSLLQYDISKVSPQMPNKFLATDVPCTYHVEVELLYVSPQTSSKELAHILLSRAKALLGTHAVSHAISHAVNNSVTSEGMKLLPPKLEKL